MTIDTNILIAFLGGEKRVEDTPMAWIEEGVSLFLLAIVESELLSFPNWTHKEQLTTERFLEEVFTPVAFDRTIARIAASLRREIKIKLPDAAIAATALFTHTPLVTRNQRDFLRVANLRLVVI